jgi:D-alanine transaminase
MTTVYLNGKFLPIEAACIPVTDRGFLFGDGVYEVIPAYGGRLFRLAQHLQRLQNSLDGIRLDNPHSNREWSAILNNLLEHNRALAGPDDDQSVYLQVTRGSAAKRDHSFPQDVVPTVFAMSSAISEPEPAVMEQGIAAVTLDDIRWQYCDIKAVTLLANVLLRQQALDRGAGEAILLREGRVVEGSASNVFVVENGNILTPAKGPEMLPGITRDLVLELAQQHQLPCQETDISEARLREADEIWITSSTREIVPVTLLDGTAVGRGTPGPLWKTMIGFYQAYKESIRKGTAE